MCVNLVKKAGFDEVAIQSLIGSFYSRYEVAESSQELLIRASHLRSKHHFSFWDSLIVTSALAAGATILYSEDMSNGLDVDGQLRIVNPFVT